MEPSTDLSPFSSEGADTFESKYGAQFTQPSGTWFGLGGAIRAGSSLVYRVPPSTAFGFAKGESFSQTRWRFSEASLESPTPRAVGADNGDRG